MRADADFMVYVAARWPALVKEAVLLGVRPEDAAAATTDALSRCRRDWGRASREENVDALVRSELELAARRRPRTDEDDREQQAQELLVLAPPTLDDLKHQQSVNNRAILRRAAVIAVPVLLAGVGAGVYFATSGDGKPAEPDDTVLANAAMSRQENPVPGVTWYADGQLHLDHTVLAIEGLEDMTRIGNGVVYGDDEGRVVYAGDDGSREVLGHKDPDVPVAATDETAWAAWVDTGSDQPAIVVDEAATGNRLARFPVDDSAQVIAVDGDRVYYSDADGAFAFTPGSDAVTLGSRVPLLDVRSRSRVFQDDPTTISVLQAIFHALYRVPGEGARLSPDGDLVATRLPDTDQVALYDTRSGKALASGIPEGDHVVAFAPGPRLTVTYIVAPARQSAGRELELRTCDADARLGETTLCWTRTRIPNTGSTPVLAR